MLIRPFRAQKSDAQASQTVLLAYLVFYDFLIKIRCTGVANCEFGPKIRRTGVANGAFWHVIILKIKFVYNSEPKSIQKRAQEALKETPRAPQRYLREPNIDS